MDCEQKKNHVFTHADHLLERFMTETHELGKLVYTGDVSFCPKHVLQICKTGVLTKAFIKHDVLKTAKGET